MIRAACGEGMRPSTDRRTALITMSLPVLSWTGYESPLILRNGRRVTRLPHPYFRQLDSTSFIASGI